MEGKTYTLEIYHKSWVGELEKVSEVTGTLDELKEMYGGVIRLGKQYTKRYNSKYHIDVEPASERSFEENLNIAAEVVGAHGHRWYSYKLR